jgi:uncharacterized protein (TIGR03437 family)
MLAAARLLAQSPPVYTADTIVNTAAGVSGSYAPNTFVTISGDNLATVTRVISQSDIHADLLPTALPGTGVRVLINAIPCFIYVVSPKQVLALIPTLLAPGPATLQLEANGVAGPPVQILLKATAPGLFTQQDGATIIAAHPDWSLITASNPAEGNEWVAIWASGLGAVNPTVPSGQIPQTALEIQDKASFTVLLNGVPLDASRIEYVGVAPGYAGLYQINIKLPSDVPPNPEIRIATGDLISPGQRYLNVR